MKPNTGVLLKLLRKELDRLLLATIEAPGAPLGGMDAQILAAVKK